MKFEKLNENKIRITLTLQDLQEKQIDFHTFMSNSIETQDLFIDMLEQAEEKYGFNTKDYRIRIEALAMADGDFVFTVTRIIPEFEKEKTTVRKKVAIKRKKVQPESKQTIYKFNSFDDFCNFIQFLANEKQFTSLNIAKEVLLYVYKNNYYLVLNNINSKYLELTKFYSAITEFANYMSNSDMFICKLKECGTLFLKHNALVIAMKHFSKNSVRK